MVDEVTVDRVLAFLKKADSPLTLNEIIASLNMRENEVIDALHYLVKVGVVKGFLREDKGKLKAVYVFLG